MPLPRRRSSWIDPSSSSPSARKHPRRRRRSRGTWFVPPRRLARGAPRRRRRRARSPRRPSARPPRRRASRHRPRRPGGPSAARPSCSRPPRRPRARGETPPNPRTGRVAKRHRRFSCPRPASPRATTPPLVARDDAEVVATPPLAVHPTGVIAAARSGEVAGRDQTRSSVGPLTPFSGQNAQYRDVSLPTSRPADILRKICASWLLLREDGHFDHAQLVSRWRSLTPVDMSKLSPRRRTP